MKVKDKIYETDMRKLFIYLLTDSTQENPYPSPPPQRKKERLHYPTIQKKKKMRPRVKTNCYSVFVVYVVHWVFLEIRGEKEYFWLS